MLNPDCNHGYDTECYPEFLLAKLKDEGMAKVITTKCVGEGCKLLISKDIWQTVLKGHPKYKFAQFED